MKLYIRIVVVSIFIVCLFLLSGCSSGGSSRYPKTYNDAYKEYQNGNKAPLEDFYKWLDKNP